MTIAPRSETSLTNANANIAQANGVRIRVTAKATGNKGFNNVVKGNNTNNTGKPNK